MWVGAVSYTHLDVYKRQISSIRPAWMVNVKFYVTYLRWKAKRCRIPCLLYTSLYEPMNRITGFDRMRLHYVAFSRAEKMLVLTGSDAPKNHFDPIWQNLPQWPYAVSYTHLPQRHIDAIGAG